MSLVDFPDHFIDNSSGSVTYLSDWGEKVMEIELDGVGFGENSI